MAFPENCVRSRNELLAHYTAKGDPHEGSPKQRFLEHLRARAIFLRDPEMYGQYGACPKGGKLTFWYALESGISEIQAPVLAAMDSLVKENLKKAVEILMSYGDLTTIPWTPQLKSVLRGFCETAKTALSALRKELDLEKIFFLLGFLDVETTLSHISQDCGVAYHIGAMISITREEDFHGKDLRCEESIKHLTVKCSPNVIYGARIVSGYLYSLVTPALDYRWHIMSALDNARYSVLKRDLKRKMKVRHTCELRRPTRKLIARAKQILEDGELLPLIPLTHLNYYKVITGSPPSPELQNGWRYETPVNDVMLFGVQGYVVYDTQIVHNLETILIYMLGKAVSVAENPNIALEVPNNCHLRNGTERMLKLLTSI